MVRFPTVVVPIEWPAGSELARLKAKVDKVNPADYDISHLVDLDVNDLRIVDEEGNIVDGGLNLVRDELGL